MSSKIQLVHIQTLEQLHNLSIENRVKFLRTTTDDFIRFLCNCLFNILENVISGFSKNDLIKWQSQIQLLVAKDVSINQKRTVWRSPKGQFLLSLIITPVLKYVKD